MYASSRNHLFSFIWIGHNTPSSQDARNFLTLRGGQNFLDRSCHGISLQGQEPRKWLPNLRGLQPRREKMKPILMLFFVPFAALAGPGGGCTDTPIVWTIYPSYTDPQTGLAMVSNIT